MMNDEVLDGNHFIILYSLFEIRYSFFYSPNVEHRMMNDEVQDGTHFIILYSSFEIRYSFF
jgi:hypothetical protein